MWVTKKHGGSVDSFQERGEVHFQSVGDAVKGRDSEVEAPIFNFADVGAVESAKIGEFILV